MREPTHDSGDALQRVQAYHALSKHTLHRSAPGPGYMDWETQPDPFRTFAGAPRMALPLMADAVASNHDALYRPVGSRPAVPLDERGVGALLELSLGLAAWKAYMEVWWALRCNPSSGNLHPTEGYLALPSHVAADWPGGVYHYVSRDHRLERRWQPAAATLAGWNQGFAPGTFLLGLSSIHWREAWKYGLRAYRYCQLDVGHAAAAVRYAAASLGWQARVLGGVADGDLARLLTLDRQGAFPDDTETDGPEREHPDLLMQIRTLPLQTESVPVAQLAGQVAVGPWLGQANRLSPRHAHAWPEIERVAQATWKPADAGEEGGVMTPYPPLSLSAPDLPAARLIRQRRSAQRYDGRTFLAKAGFFRLLDSCLPRPGSSPWDLLDGPPRLHLFLMVHRVTDLTPGLYALVRRAEALPMLQRALQGRFLWQPVAGAPDHLPLYCLSHGDLRAVAQQLSCQQEIAADGVFSLGMVGEFEAALARGPWAYRQLFWEAGMLGQVLYLEAEAAGIRGTGIGCYFDDTFHQLLGVQGTHLQSMYHFTVGGPLADNRLQSRPPYDHLQGRKRGQW
ncbi:MAG: SagB/ThcOx family dehydrogenase [Magnetococcus sp. MYC-9]